MKGSYCVLSCEEYWKKMEKKKLLFLFSTKHAWTNVSKSHRRQMQNLVLNFSMSEYLTTTSFGITSLPIAILFPVYGSGWILIAIYIM